MFTILCVNGDITLQIAMLDLGASINIIPYSLYKSLKLGTLIEIGVVISMDQLNNLWILKLFLIDMVKQSLYVWSLPPNTV